MWSRNVPLSPPTSISNSPDRGGGDQVVGPQRMSHVLIFALHAGLFPTTAYKLVWSAGCLIQKSMVKSLVPKSPVFVSNVTTLLAPSKLKARSTSPTSYSMSVAVPLLVLMMSSASPSAGH